MTIRRKRLKHGEDITVIYRKDSKLKIHYNFFHGYNPKSYNGKHLNTIYRKTIVDGLVIKNEFWKVVTSKDKETVLMNTFKLIEDNER